MKEEFKELKSESLHLAGSYYNLAGLKFLRYASKQWSRIATQIILAAFAGLILLFFSFGVAFFLADVYSNMALGFAVVGGFYLVVIFFMIAFKKAFLLDPIRNVFIKNAGDEITWYKRKRDEEPKEH